MNIMVVCDEYYPNPSAASLCVKRVVSHLQYCGATIDVLNITSKPSMRSEEQIDHSCLYNITNWYAIDLKQWKNKRNSRLKTASLLFYKGLGKIYRYPIKRGISRNIIACLNKVGDKYDCIIAVVANFNNAYAAVRYGNKTNKPVIIYQVDPIATNYCLKQYKKKLQKLEKYLYDGAKYVFTTPIIKEEQEKLGRVDLNKFIPVEFPNVVNLCAAPINRANEQIVCTFCGNIYGGIRDARYTLELFSKLPPNSNVVLHFIGAGQQDLLEEYEAGALRGRLIRKGTLSKEESVQCMQQSDFLINIGNVVTNQVPSKIFDYISTGLPIINICVNADCPTIPYLTKYGLALNVIQSDNGNIPQDQIKLLQEFLTTAQGKRLEYKEIHEKFLTCTPEYVAKLMLSKFS